MIFTNPARFVAVILRVQGRYVLQLRDDHPAIADPGVWALFGGGVEPGEEFIAAAHREIQEELDLHLTNCRWTESLDYTDKTSGTTSECAVFEADVTEHWNRHRLREGQAADLFEYDQLAALSMASFARLILTRHHAKQLNFLPRITSGPQSH